ncbi:hypothetical protein AKO1_007051, partial [Acrasis kona]
MSTTTGPSSNKKHDSQDASDTMTDREADLNSSSTTPKDFAMFPLYPISLSPASMSSNTTPRNGFDGYTFMSSPSNLFSPSSGGIMFPIGLDGDSGVPTPRALGGNGSSYKSFDQSEFDNETGFKLANVDWSKKQVKDS